MHVVQIIDTLSRGGAQQLLVTFAHEARQRAVDTTVMVLNGDDKGSVLADGLRQLGSHVVRFPASSMLNPKRLSSMAHYLRRGKFSVVHTHLTYANVLGVLAARLANIPVVASLHLAGFDPSLVGRQQHLENVILQRFCQQLIAVGYTTEEVYRPMLKNRHIWVIPNAVTPLPRISPAEREELRRTLMGNPDYPMLLTVGRLTAIKAQPDLIDAFALVHERHPTARLIIAGSGDNQPLIEACIAAHQLHDAVSLLGARDDVARLLGSADLFVSSSIQEGLPIAMLEAMSVGLPIVGTTVGDVPHILRGQAGITVPPRQPALLAEKIIELLDHPSRIQAMRQYALEISAEHSPQAWVDQLLQVYQAAHEGKQ